VKTGLVPNRDRLGNFFSQVSYGGGYPGALQAVLRGQADVAAVSEYTLGAPYITAEEAQRLRILYSIPGVPAHGIVVDDRVPAQMRERVISALLKLNQSGNNKLLRDLYNSTELVRVDHDRHVKPMFEALQRAGIEP
jgi:phosphonate transport system substrate-binding protein